MSSSSTSDGLDETIRDWLFAFAGGDVDEIVEHYHAPLLVALPEEWHWLLEEAEVAEFLGRYVDEMGRDDYADSDTEALHVHRLTDDDAVVSLSVVRFGEDGEAADRVGFTDLFHRTDDGWKVAVAIEHDHEAVIA